MLDVHLAMLTPVLPQAASAVSEDDILMSLPLPLQRLASEQQTLLVRTLARLSTDVRECLRTTPSGADLTPEDKHPHSLANVGAQLHGTPRRPARVPRELGTTGGGAVHREACDCRRPGFPRPSR